MIDSSFFFLKLYFDIVFKAEQSFCLCPKSELLQQALQNRKRKDESNRLPPDRFLPVKLLRGAVTITAFDQKAITNPQHP